MKPENRSYSSVVLRLIPLFILLASLLVLPNSGCKWKSIGDTFEIGQLKYEVITQDRASKTGTVSVKAASTNISGDIEIPASVTNGGIIYSVNFIRNGAFSGCSSLTSIVVSDNVTSIGNSAFYVCSNLTSIVIPNSVTSIGNKAFFGCSNLTGIVIPDSVATIGDYAFSFCSCLKSIEIPDSVTSIGKYAFLKCSSLTNIEIPDSVIGIGDSTFSFCSRLKSATIGQSVTSIGDYAFSNCSKLTAVYFKGNAPKLPEGNAFFDPSVIYYKPGTAGWTNPWDGRPAKEWVE